MYRAVSAVMLYKQQVKKMLELGFLCILCVSEEACVRLQPFSLVEKQQLVGMNKLEAKECKMKKI